jgi:3-methyladenine DNA glycosylase AlkD
MHFARWLRWHQGNFRPERSDSAVTFFFSAQRGKMSKKSDELIEHLKSLANPKDAEGMAHFGVGGENALGIRIPVLRKIAKSHRKDHQLATALWASGIHEARILASMVDDPEQVTGEQMESWVGDFDSWDVCDQVCMNLFDKHPLAFQKAVEWSQREEEFVKRAGFAMMATLALHDKTADDSAFEPFFAQMQAGAQDDRNFVKKAVNWSLRQIGKKRPGLAKRCVRLAQELAESDPNSARWIGKDALREFKKKGIGT